MRNLLIFKTCSNLILWVVVSLISNFVQAQTTSKVPPCQGEFMVLGNVWNNCFGTVGMDPEKSGVWSENVLKQGTFKYSSGAKYVGGLYTTNDFGLSTPKGFHGQGTLTFPNGQTYTGDFKYGGIVATDALINRANNDVTAQALNYVSGFGENQPSHALAFWVSTSALKSSQPSCTYMMTGTPLGDFFKSKFVDLNRGNPDAVEFFTTSTNTYITRVDGLPEFRCRNCNGARVQRAWALIYKECQGTRKAF
jgi:hypothetical protein